LFLVEQARQSAMDSGAAKRSFAAQKATNVLWD